MSFHGLNLTLQDLIALRPYALSAFKNIPKKNNSSLAADKLSKLHGRGMDFAEVRHYQAGDDIRVIDWRVTARTGKPHTKLFQEEKERPVYIILDLSAPMQFGSQVTFKSITALQCAALLAWRVLYNHDRLGGLVFNDDSFDFSKATYGSSPTLRFLKSCLAKNSLNPDYTRSSCEQLFIGLSQYRSLIKAGSKVYFISDFSFLNDPNVIASEAKQSKNILQQLAKSCEMDFLYIYDLLESKAPEPNLYTVSDGKQWLQFDSGNVQFNKAYEEQFLEKLTNLKKFCAQNKILFKTISTADTLVKGF